MTYLDLKQHASDYAQQFCPHLKGEFQAFAQWVEHEHPADTPQFIPPVSTELAPVEAPPAEDDKPKG